MRQIFENAFLDVVECPDCKCELSGLIQRDDNGNPYFIGNCDCGETIVSCFDLFFEDDGDGELNNILSFAVNQSAVIGATVYEAIRDSYKTYSGKREAESILNRGIK